MPEIEKDRFFNFMESHRMVRCRGRVQTVVVCCAVYNKRNSIHIQMGTNIKIKNQSIHM